MTSVLTEFGREGWGPGGDDFAWWCTEAPEAFTSDRSVYRSQEPVGVRIGRGASTYLGTMFDAGPRARITLGDFALVHGARIICDAEVAIGVIR